MRSGIALGVLLCTLMVVVFLEETNAQRDLEYDSAQDFHAEDNEDSDQSDDTDEFQREARAQPSAARWGRRWSNYRDERQLRGREQRQLRG